ncbi:MAG: fibrinogen-like YCDxxxxGGGW domain-containing protein, partial [Actinomycetota bacterium]|nr:fibrinogen-like YCDxxxxGGGW domain-containing protein [Actinomycetota bacterium]
IAAGEDCDDDDDTLGAIAEDTDCDGVLTADDCDDTLATSTTRATDADCDGTVTAEDCYDDDPAVGVECPLVSCKDLHDDDDTLANGLYELSVPGFDPFEAYCDMDGGGWTLVYLAWVDAGSSSGEMIAGTGDLGDVAPTPDETGHWKLHDDKINALRSGGVTNDIRVRAFAGSSLVGDSWHPSSCSVTWATATTDADCLESTRSGPSATDYTTSGHAGALTRWYVDGSFGYILPHTHLGPVSGGHSHGGSLPNPYCTFYDSRTCPQPSKFHVWVY